MVSPKTIHLPRGKRIQTHRAAVLPTELPAVDPSLPEGTRLVIRALRESNPQTEIELAKAIELMLDVEQYQQASYYLSRLQAFALDEASLFRIYEAMGSDFFLALHAIGDAIPAGARIFPTSDVSCRQSRQKSRADQPTGQPIE